MNYPTVAVRILGFAAAALGLFGVGNAHGGDIGTISGALFHDLNENGTQDVGEPGLAGNPIELLADGEPAQTTETESGGSYSFAAPPGDYSLRADTDFHAFLCVDTFGSFSPLALDGCISPEVPWAFTTAQEEIIMMEADEEVEVDFGVREMDIMLLAGRAIYYPSGSSEPVERLEAFHGGTKCGETELKSGTPHDYELAVLGAAEVPGCPEPGDEVTFTIDGLEATSQGCGDVCAVYPVFYGPTDDDVEIKHLVAIENHAIYWTQELAYPDASPSSPGTYAAVDGGVCHGAATQLIVDFFGDKWIGFPGLTVPHQDELPDGSGASCGYEGAEVRFRLGFNGPEFGTVAIWEPGIHRIDIDFAKAVGSGDVNCDEDVDALDALGILEIAAGFPSYPQCHLVGDINCSGGDGFVDRDALDALLVLRYKAALPYQLPPGCPPVNQAGP